LAVDELSEDFVVNQKIIVLTEGSTDTPILSRSLAVLYPHVQDFYSFVDFTASNLAGGAGALVSTIKAFVGSGIQNRTVALFDNDTAARDALRALSGVNLPGNIKIVQLSALDFAKEYPTIGPQGQVDISRSSSSWRGNSVSPEERFNRLGRYRSTPSPTPRRSRR
jgi:hypothetical protein